MAHREYYRRRLPHWQPLGATVFVTFRLADSLPQAVIDQLLDERETELQMAARLDAAQRRSQEYVDERRAFARWDSMLDRCAEGPLWLRRPDIAGIVAEALHYRDAKVYDLLAFCIMPNHVHLVCTPLPLGRTDSPPYDPDVARAVSPRSYDPEVARTVSPRSDADVMRTDSPRDDVHSLQGILQSLKGRTAWLANRRLGRQGTFWQAESYDHVIRDGEELERVVHYVVNNPVKAGLVESWRDWSWTYRKAD